MQKFSNPQIWTLEARIAAELLRACESQNSQFLDSWSTWVMKFWRVPGADANKLPEGFGADS